MERGKLNNNYFLQQNKLDFISTGCNILNSTLGGGHPVGRIINVVGDRSTGKTLLAMEVIANFLKKYPKNIVCYHEAEAAFDQQYAEALGIPLGEVIFKKDKLIEEMYENILECLDKAKGEPCLYIIDSLDALSDLAESKRELTDGTFGTKAKQLGIMFRKIIQKVEEGKMLLYVISQIRDKIGVSFGETKMRSGGHALDFYASQIIWLYEIKKITKMIDGITRPIGIMIKSKVKKNKVGLAYRECVFPIIFGYGVDSIAANYEYLKGVKKLPEGINIRSLTSASNKLRDSGDVEKIKELDDYTIKVYLEIEEKFLPKRRKY